MRFAASVCCPLLVLACAGAPPGVAHEPGRSRSPSSASGALSSAARPAAAEQEQAAKFASPEAAVSEADGVYRDQLAVPGRDPRFAVDRQIAALERAIDLYREFLARAGDEPRFAEAAKRSRERIVDAEETITFLRQQAESDSP